MILFFPFACVYCNRVYEGEKDILQLYIAEFFLPNFSLFFSRARNVLCRTLSFNTEVSIATDGAIAQVNTRAQVYIGGKR